MARSDNLLLAYMSGRIGKTLIVKNYGGKIVLSKKPDMKGRKLSPEQKKSNRRFKEASWYAKATMEYEILRDAAQLRLNVPKEKLFHALMSEYFRDPEQATIASKILREEAKKGPLNKVQPTKRVYKRKKN